MRDAVKARGTQAVLLVDGSSYDSKNYLGLGSLDFLAHLLCPDRRHRPLCAHRCPHWRRRRRWPVRTEEELTTVVDQILAYEDKASNGYAMTAVFATDRYDSA